MHLADDATASTDTTASPPITVGDLLDMLGGQDPHSVTIIVRTEDDQYQLPSETVVDNAFVTTHRNGLTELTLDLS